MLTDREMLKRKIDELPESTIDEIRKLIASSNTSKTNGGKGRRTRKLGGRFDNVDMRKLAYE